MTFGTEKETETCVCDVLTELVEEQKELKDFLLICKYFRHMVEEKKGEGLVPFMLYMEDQIDLPFQLSALEKNTETDGISCLKTPFFAVESVDNKNCCATLILLRPVDMDGNDTDQLSDLFRLERTKSCTEIDVSCFCAIQCLDPRLVNRELPVIEPKW
jgi:spore coat protein Y